MPYDRLLGRYEQAIDFHEQEFLQHEHVRDLKTLEHSVRWATAAINLGRSCLAQARDMRHHQAAIPDTEHASPVVAQQLDLAHPLLGGISHHVAPDLLLRAKELFTTALSVSVEYGIWWVSGVAGVLDAGKNDTKALLCSPAAAAVLHGSSFLLTFFARNLIL